MVDLNKLRLYKQAEEIAHGYRCAIGTNCYAKTYDYIQQLVAIAKADYPLLDDSDIVVTFYGGDQRRKMLAIEFDVLELANGYAVTELEPTLA